MSQPRFANKWYKNPPISELRQEIQHAHNNITTVEDEKVKNAGSTPAIIAGAADSTDADGNPTPNTTTFPPANYDEGTLFFATSYPSGVDGGSMQFRQEGGAWVWRWGSYSASSTFSGIGNGKYRRGADGHQVCWESWASQTTSSSSVGSAATIAYVIPVASWGFPAVFSEAPRIISTGHKSSGTGIAWGGAGLGAVSTTVAENFLLASNDTGLQGTLFLDAIGEWK